MTNYVVIDPGNTVSYIFSFLYWIYLEFITSASIYESPDRMKLIGESLCRWRVMKLLIIHFIIAVTFGNIIRNFDPKHDSKFQWSSISYLFIHTLKHNPFFNSFGDHLGLFKSSGLALKAFVIQILLWFPFSILHQRFKSLNCFKYRLICLSKSYIGENRIIRKPVSDEASKIPELSWVFSFPFLILTPISTF